jgi:hypothetical protein
MQFLLNYCGARRILGAALSHSSLRVAIFSTSTFQSKFISAGEE